MTTAQPAFRPAPDQLCDYRLQTWLKPSQTALCVSDSGRRVVLKALPSECLQAGTGALHLLVRERLTRVQQLAHRQLATLLGVQRDAAGGVYLVWEYIEGQSLEQYLAAPARPPRQALLALRELLLATESLHAMGLVHGALCAGNVIMTSTDDLKLTHVSPLLHQDALADTLSVGDILRSALDGCHLRNTPPGHAITRHLAEDASLLQIAADISRLLEEPAQRASTPADQPPDRQRRRACQAALICAALVILTAGLAWWRLSSRAIPAARPPEASPELLEPRSF